MARLPEGLPDILWVEIYDFTRQNALSRVCRRLWILLQKRHHKLRLSGDRLPRWVEWCGDQVPSPAPNYSGTGAQVHVQLVEGRLQLRNSSHCAFCYALGKGCRHNVPFGTPGSRLALPPHHSVQSIVRIIGAPCSAFLPPPDLLVPR